MQGQFWKNFRGPRPGPRGPRCPIRPAGRVPRAAARPPPSFPAPARPPPGTSRHETGPSTTFGRHPPTMASRAKIKPQVDGLRFSRNTGYGRGAGTKRSRWAGFVAAASQTADRGHPEVAGQPSNDRFPANCTVRWPVAPFPLSFGLLFCTYSANPSASKGFARSHQAARHR